MSGILNSRLGAVQPSALQGVQLSPLLPKEDKGASLVDTSTFVEPETGVLRSIGVLREQDTYVAPKASPMVVLGASMFPMGTALYAAYREDAQGFDKDPSFDAIQYAADALKTLGDLSPEEQLQLESARSAEHADWRVQRILDERIRRQTQAQNLWVALPAAAVDIDIAAGFGAASAAKALPKAWSVSRAGATAVGIGAAGATAGATLQWEADTRSDSEKIVDAVFMGLGAGLGIRSARSLKSGVNRQLDAVESPESAWEASQSAVKASQSAQDSISTAGVGYPTRTAEDALYEQSRAISDAVQNSDSIPQSLDTSLTKGLTNPENRAGYYDAAAIERNLQRLEKIDAAEPFLKSSVEDVLELQDELGTVRVPVRNFEPAADTNSLLKRIAAGTAGRAQAGASRIKQYLSTLDKLHYFSKNASPEDWETLNRLFPDAAFQNYDTAINRAVLYQQKGTAALNELDVALGDAAKQYYGAGGRFSSLNPLMAKRQLNAELQVMQDTSRTLRQLYAAEKRARQLDMPFDVAKELQRLAPNKGVQAAVEAYMRSGFAEQHLKQMQLSGVKGAERVASSALYTPLRWDYGKMLQAFQRGIPRAAVAKMFGQDLAERFPDLLKYGRTSEMLGEEFIRTQELAAQGMYQKPLAATRDTVQQMLRNFGVQEAEADMLIERMFQQVDEAGKPKYLKRRNDWDFERISIINGEKFTLGDFANDDLMQNLRSYNSMSAHRAGLAHYGIQGESDLKALFTRLMQNPVEGVSQREYHEFFEEVTNQLLGRPVGGALPEFARTMEAVAYALNMSNSGIYNLADFTVMANDLGMLRTVRHTVKTMPKVFQEVRNLKPKEAQRLRDILAGDILAEGRVQYFVTHFEDMHAMQTGVFSSVVHKAVQSVKFLNSSEFIRRWQVNAIASAYEEMLETAVTQAGKQRDYFKGIGMTDEDLSAIAEQIQKHGLYMHKWPQGISLRAQQLMIGASDNIAMRVQKGEAPAFLEQTVAGKVLFPYMRYAMAGNQKVLRRTAHDAGAAGVAQLLFYQATLSPVLAAAINVTNGRPWDKNLEVLSLRAATSLGYFSIGMDAVLAGGMKGSAAVFSPLNSTFQLGRAVAADDIQAYDVANAIPLLGISQVQQALGVLKSLQAQDEQNLRNLD